MVRATTLPQLAREDFFLGARLIFCLRGSNVITVATCTLEHHLITTGCNDRAIRVI